MQSRPRLFGFLAAAILLILAFVALTTLRQPSPPTAVSFDANVTIDPLATVPGLTTDDLTNPRPVLSPELKAAMNQMRGRPPVLPGDYPDLRRDWFWHQRAYPLDTVPYDANLKALTYVAESMPLAAQSADQTWQSIGPNSITQGLIGLHSCTDAGCGAWRTNVSGRTKTIVFNPNNPNTLYVATASGGLWKSTDGGATYTAISDTQPSLAFHSLALDPTNPNILYAGTGEIQGHYGMGLLKSTNGGQSWTLLGANQFKGLVIAAIVIHPTSPNTLWVATNLMNQDAGPAFPVRGVFRSNDGGQTWSPQLTCDRCAGVSDLVMNSANPQVLYAGGAGFGVFKTTDGGANWAQLTGGLPDRGFNRVELAIGSGGSAHILYAGLAARVSTGQGVVPWGLIYRSADGGASWELLRNTPNYCSQQCDYDNIIAVSPNDANLVYIGGSFISNEQGWAGMVHKTTNGGQSWQDVTPGGAVTRVVHPDMHAITFKPGNANEIWIGNDGGVFRSTNGGNTWEQRNGNLATLQFVNIGVHPTNANIMFGGLQDNAKAKWVGGVWTGLDTGDGGWSEIDPFNPSIWYSTRYSMQGSIVQFQRNNNNGTASLNDWQQKADGIDINDRMLFYVPFVLDVKQQGVLYLGTHRLYRTANRGDSWQAISGDLTRGAQTGGAISAIAVAPNDSNTLYTGSSDGIVAVTRNRGESWTNATKAPLPNRHVSDIVVHPTNAAVAYVTFNGYDTHTPGQAGHVFKTTNAGGSWQNVSNNLPDIPILTIALDPRNPDHLYIGSDIGVFRSTNGGSSWASYNDGLPNVQVFDLELNDTTRHLWAGTYGRGVFRLSLAGTPPTATPTPTRTPTLPPLTRRLYLPVTIKSVARPQPTPTLPPQGPAPGDWTGDKAQFGVATNQQDVWNIRIRVPVPGCDTWVMHAAFVRISQSRFMYTVDLRENGLWTNEGTFTSRTQAQGTARFQNMYFGQSCGTWSGDVAWTATWQGSASDPTVTPTPTRRPPTATPSSRAGIYGQFRYRGVGVAGLKLWLRKCPANAACNFQTSKVASALTDANGYYQFTGVPALPAGHFYTVYFLNSPDGENPGDDRYLWRWFGRVINTYSAGANVHGGDADVEDIHLTGPSAEEITLPATFTWAARSQPGERYAWELFDPETGATLCYSDPATSTSFQLTASTFTNNCGGAYDRSYGWFAWVVDGATWDNNNGYGDSYYYTSHIIRSGGGPTPTPTRTPTSVSATATPTRTPTPVSASISGRVTAAGSGAGGLTLQLLGCSSGCAVVGSGVTAGNGNYSFTGLAAPGPGEYYVVRYINGGGVNTFNANYLGYWLTKAISTLPAANLNFDIRDVALQAPAHNTNAYLPITFSWASRSIGTDRFAWATSYSGTQFCTQSSPQNATSFTLDLTAATSCGMYTLTPYDWYVYVTNGANFNNGYGISGFARTYTILGAVGAVERRLPGRGEQEPSSSFALPAELIPAIPEAFGQ